MANLCWNSVAQLFPSHQGSLPHYLKKCVQSVHLIKACCFVIQTTGSTIKSNMPLTSCPWRAAESMEGRSDRALRDEKHSFRTCWPPGSLNFLVPKQIWHIGFPHTRLETFFVLVLLPCPFPMLQHQGHSACFLLLHFFFNQSQSVTVGLLPSALETSLSSYPMHVKMLQLRRNDDDEASVITYICWKHEGQEASNR